jgi:hypothetical protein
MRITEKEVPSEIVNQLSPVEGKIVSLFCVSKDLQFQVIAKRRCTFLTFCLSSNLQLRTLYPLGLSLQISFDSCTRENGLIAVGRRQLRGENGLVAE